MRVLCLDIEGGYGGSSRSLYESIRHLDRSEVRAEVWCRQAGPIQARYAGIGVPCRVTPRMPKVSTLPRLSRNLIIYSEALRDFWKSVQFRDELLRSVRERFDLVHFNHEALFLLARWLRERTAVPFTMHVRTNLADTMLSRWQIRTIARTMDHLVFITENEQKTFHRLGGSCVGTVIYNVVTPPDSSVEPDPRVPHDRRLKIACLSNYAWQRGLDRLIEVAECLVAGGRRDFLFVVAGNMEAPTHIPGTLRKIVRRNSTFPDAVEKRGLGDMFLFLGHVPEPERALVACNVLAKPTRENNPWGRDIIEALACGKPVMTVGSYDRFVKTGETGLLREVFSPQEWAQQLVGFAKNPRLLATMGEQARQRVARLCNGRDRAADLLAVWTKLVPA